LDQGGDFCGGIFHGGAVQFLGELHSAGVSAALARDGGELRGEYWRENFGNSGGVADDNVFGVEPAESGEDCGGGRGGGGTLCAGGDGADEVVAGAEEGGVAGGERGSG